MIVTNDEKLAVRLRALRITGRRANTSAPSAAGTAGWTNCSRRPAREIASHGGMDSHSAGARPAYTILCSRFARVGLPRAPAGSEHVYYLYTIRVEVRAGRQQPANDWGNELRSDLVQQRLKERGIASIVDSPCSAALAAAVRLTRRKARGPARERASRARSAFHSAVPGTYARANRARRAGVAKQCCRIEELARELTFFRLAV